MGDLVLFEDEVNPVMSAALDNGLEVTALHNHFFFDKPHVLFMHIGGEGARRQLGQGREGRARRREGGTHEVRRSRASASARRRPAPSTIDAAKLDARLRRRRAPPKDGMYKAVIGRKTQAACGCTIGKAMGVNTWAAFAGTRRQRGRRRRLRRRRERAAARAQGAARGGINVVAIHSHMTGESPRILFLHYWGRGAAAALSAAVKRAVDLTAWDGKPTRT